MTGKEMAAAVLDAVRRAVAAATSAIEGRLAALEARVAAIPRGEKGDPGDHGLDGRDGKDGLPGERGAPGRDGRSVSIEEVRALLVDMVKTVPAGKDGKDGASITVEDALPALERLIEAQAARWELAFERRALETMQRAVDRIPPPADGRDGKDGIDGFGFDDMTVTHDGERGVTLRFAKGDRVKEFAFEIPSVIDRGYWKEGAEVRKGDGVTHGGSYWIAQVDTKSKPDIGNPDFRLAVKRGRDGKDGDRGPMGPQGDKGMPGLNGKNVA